MPFLRHTLPFRRRARDKTVTPPKPSKPRPKLTPPDQETINASQRQSFFFSKLPAEVRLLIYDLVLPQAKQSHVVHQSLRANQVAWPSDSVEFTEKHAAFWHGDQDFTWAGYAWPWPGRVVPNVLLVCWRLYDEALTYLYSTRIYHFDTPVEFVRLHDSATQRHFNSITMLRFVFCSNYSASRAELNNGIWKAALEILTKMPNLHSFHVLLSYECWRDFFYLQSTSYKDNTRALTPPAWTLSGLSAKTVYKPEDVLPHLEWVKKVKAQGEALVQLIQRSTVFDESKGGVVSLVRTFRYRVEDGKFVKLYNDV